jgi:hypothetical protein
VPHRILPLAVIAFAFGLFVCSTAAAPQRARPAAVPKLPPLAMTCPMHPDVIEDKPGSCPLCKMALVPVRLESIWSCPIHAAIHEQGPGACPICKRSLIQMTVALTWTCKDRPDIDQIEPGRCPDGSTTIAKRTLRPHGNHNPQHGGQFFMAPDTWHHIEGTYPRQRVFRLYLYDDYARPLPLDQVKQVSARVVTREDFDSATRRTKELSAFPLAAPAGAAYLEARIDAAALPATMTAKVRFKGDGQEYRFDFTFPQLTADPNVVASTAAKRPAVRTPPTAAKGPGVQATAAPVTDAATIDPASIRVAIPGTIPEIVALLNTRRQQIRELIDKGDFAAVWVPALQAKDLAIALEARLPALAPALRASGEPGLDRLVRTAWLLDAVGDVGNRQQISDAYATFSAAVADVTAAFSN